MIHIAIAEDHVSLSDGLKLFLEQDNDIKVMFTVPNGKEMLLKLERMRPEVILTDISMPEMNGVEFLKTFLRYRNIPTAIISSISLAESNIVAKFFEKTKKIEIKKKNLTKFSEKVFRKRANFPKF